MTKEQSLISLLFHIAKADGTVTNSELEAIADIASRLKDFNTEEIKKAMADKKILDADLKEVCAAVDINDKVKVLFGCCYVIAADNIIKLEEVYKLHEIAQLMDVHAAVVTYYMSKVIGEYPDIKFEDEE